MLVSLAARAQEGVLPVLKGIKLPAITHFRLVSS